MKRAVILGVLLATVASCKKESQDSDTQFDPAVFSSLSMYSLQPEEVDTICRQSALIVFVGNAEHPAEKKLSGSVELEDSALDRLIPDYPVIVQHEANALREALAHQHSRCKSLATKNPGKLGNIAFLSLIDGPGKNDTKIATTYYGWKRDGRRQTWHMSDEQFWAWKGNKLEKADRDSQQEVHLPTQLSKIVNSVFRENAAGYNMTMYFFKTHGSRLRVESQDDKVSYPSPDLRLLAYGPDQMRGITAQAKPAFLFDPHGPGTTDFSKTSPELVSPYWLKTTSCKLLANSDDIDKAALGKNWEACLACRSVLKGYQGNFAGCATTEEEISAQAAVLQGDMGNQTTQGDMGNQTTQGDMGNQTTQGDMGNQTTQGDMGNQTTQGDMGNQTTQGDMGNQTTQGDMGNQTTQGTGKGFLFLSEIKLNDENKPMTSPMGGYLFASGATYGAGSLEIEGLTDLSGSLPSGNLVSTEPLTIIGDEYVQISDERAIAPTLVILDSCYGDGNFKDVIKNLREVDNNPVVVVSNPAPLYSTILNYGSLDAARYKAFAFVYYWYAHYEKQGTLNEHSYIRNTKEELDKHMGSRGIYDLPKLYEAISSERQDIAAGRFVLSDERRKQLYKKDLYRQLQVDTFIE